MSNPTLKELLRGMIASGKLYGTILRHPINMSLWWSPEYYHSPKDAILRSESAWVYLGLEHWWIDEEHKQQFITLRVLAGSYPSWPGEYDSFDHNSEIAE